MIITASSLLILAKRRKYDFTRIESQFKNEISSKQIGHASLNESFSSEEKALLRKMATDVAFARELSC